MLASASDGLRLGPNMVHAAVLHSQDADLVKALDGWMADSFHHAVLEHERLRRRPRLLRRPAPGPVMPRILRPLTEDLGWSTNVLTTANNGGRDMFAQNGVGLAGFGVSGTIATASSSTSLTATSTPFVASAYIGMIVVAEESTNAPVWGVVVSNTTSVLTIDGWKNGDGTAGNTPGSTANYLILPGTAPYRYMALTENASAASASSTALTGEITSGGCGRATAAHTLGTGTATLAKTFSVSSTFPAIHRVGIFQLSTASSSVLGFEAVLNADANVVSGDSLAVTWTLTVS